MQSFNEIIFKMKLNFQHKFQINVKIWHNLGFFCDFLFIRENGKKPYNPALGKLLRKTHLLRMAIKPKKITKKSS